LNGGGAEHPEVMVRAYPVYSAVRIDGGVVESMELVDMVV
jgi:hypothetical protein